MDTKKQSVVTREEIRRLEKAAKDKDKRKLAEWADQFEDQIRENLISQYKKIFTDELNDAIDVFTLAIAYTLRYNEYTQFDDVKLPDFMEDMYVTVDMFRTGEYSPEDYFDDLEKCGIHFDRLKYKLKHSVVTDTSVKHLSDAYENGDK